MQNAYYADFIWYDSAEHKNSWLLTNGSLIEGISSEEPSAEYVRTVFGNSAIFPGLINTHTHLAMSLFRGMADDLPLMDWLRNYIWPAEKKYLNPDFVYNASLLSLIECVKSGVTCVNDMYFFPERTAEALRRIGIKGFIGFGIMSDFEGALKKAEKFESDELVKPSLVPHALYTCGPDAVAMCAEFAREKGILFHTHLAETEAETELIKSKYGKTPAILMNETGAFDCTAVFAHCVHLTDEEISLMGEKRVGISHCAESNLKLASGFCPAVPLTEAGAVVSLGTDGPASNNRQSILREMSCVSKLHKALNKNASVMKASQVLEMASANAAKVLGLNDTGVLKEGFSADFFVLSFEEAHMTPVYDAVSHLAYAADDSDITHVYVNGRPVMENRIISAFDEEKVKEAARKAVKSITG